MSDEDDETRRRFLLLAAVGATTGLAGCSGDGDGGGQEPAPSPADTPAATQTQTQIETGGATETLGPVPEEYGTATAIDGTRRNPDGLSTKEAVQYQSQPKGDQQCSNCRFYVPDRNGDGLGACAIVEGQIQPEAWCASYAAAPTDSDGG
jgi:hypothetical protein